MGRYLAILLAVVSSIAFAEVKPTFEFVGGAVLTGYSENPAPGVTMNKNSGGLGFKLGFVKEAGAVNFGADIGFNWLGIYTARTLAGDFTQTVYAYSATANIGIPVGNSGVEIQLRGGPAVGVVLFDDQSETESAMTYGAGVIIPFGGKRSGNYFRMGVDAGEPESGIEFGFYSIGFYRRGF